MKLRRVEPAREFTVGRQGTRISHVADLELAPDELITLHTESGAELDVARKSWGFYATPSLNGRLQAKGLRAALVENVGRGVLFLLLVEPGRETDFEAYCVGDDMRVVCWLDSDEAVADAIRRLDA